MSSVLNAAAFLLLLPRPQQKFFLFRHHRHHNRHLLLPFLLLLTLYLSTSVGSAVPLMAAPTTSAAAVEQQQSVKRSSGTASASSSAHPHPHLEDDLLLAPASSSAPEWADILAKMTADNPCGSAANYSLCQQCGKSTGDPKAFYLCCVNSDDVRQFCSDFVNHTIPWFTSPLPTYLYYYYFSQMIQFESTQKSPDRQTD